MGQVNIVGIKLGLLEGFSQMRSSRWFYRLVVALTGLFAATPFLAADEHLEKVPAAPSLQRPLNVVFIISDDQHWRDYGFMGHAHLRTPHLDRLARESLVFRRGYVPTSLCCPSLASLITGRYPHQHRITGNDPPAGLPAKAGREQMNKHLEEWPTLPKLVRDQGYKSLQTGKWWQGNFSRGGFTDGMTKGVRHGDDGLEIGRKTMQPIQDFVTACQAEHKPFFVWYAPMLPHDPHDPPKDLVDHYAALTPSIHLARYWGNIERFDRTVGELIHFLDRQKLSEETLVVYVTDNGWIQNPDRPEYAPRSKRTPYEGGIRTPIMLRQVGKIEPAVSESLASSIDIMPTVLAACGIQPPAGLPGVNLLDTQAVTARRQIFGECFTHTLIDLDDPVLNLLSRWTVRDNWKLIVPHKDGPVELFDLGKDPEETQNLSASHSDEVQLLRESLKAAWPLSPAR